MDSSKKSVDKELSETSEAKIEAAKKFLSENGLLPHIYNLLGLVGASFLEDFKEIDDELLGEIEKCVRSESFLGGEISKSDCLKYFGSSERSVFSSISSFAFTLLERRKLKRVAEGAGQAYEVLEAARVRKKAELETAAKQSIGKRSRASTSCGPNQPSKKIRLAIDSDSVDLTGALDVIGAEGEAFEPRDPINTQRLDSKSIVLRSKVVSAMVNLLHDAHLPTEVLPSQVSVRWEINDGVVHYKVIASCSLCGESFKIPLLKDTICCNTYKRHLQRAHKHGNGDETQLEQGRQQARINTFFQPSNGPSTSSATAAAQTQGKLALQKNAKLCGRSTNIKANIDHKQTQMLEFLQPTDRDTLIIKELLAQRDSFSQLLEAQPPLEARLRLSPGESPFQPPKGRGRPPFAESVIKFAYYIYATGGVKAYDTLLANSRGDSKLPSLSAVKKFGMKQPSITEGELQLDSLKNALSSRGLPLAVWLSEDDTRLLSVLKYNSKTNEIIGLDLPIGDNGMPITGSYRFTSIKNAMACIKKNPMSTYLKLVAARSLQKDGYKFMLLAYGTSAGGTGGQTAGVKLRWKTIIDALQSAGIRVYGISSDGFGPFLRNMQEVMELPYEKAARHPLFGEFFSASQEPDYLCSQDGMHAVVKAFGALRNNVLTIGKHTAAMSHVKNLLARAGRVIVGISEADIEANKDAMNYSIAARICKPRVWTLLKNECEQATALYLNMMDRMIKAYIDDDSTPAERIFEAWYCVFFCRYWKDSLQQEGKSLATCFISRNLQASIEINGHTLLLFIQRCRDEGKPELMLFGLAGSQADEEFFRTLRTMATALYTKTNFNVKEALDNLKRVQLLADIAASADSFSYVENARREKRHAKTFVPNELPGDEEMKTIISSGNETVKNGLFALGIHASPGFPAINLSKPPAMKPERKENSESEHDTQDAEQAEPAFVEAVDDLQVLLDHLHNAPLDEEGCLPEIDVPENALRIVPPEQVLGASEKERLNFIYFARGDEVFKVPKSTILFMITERGNPVSTDRLQRFIVDNTPLAVITARSGRCEKICIGDWLVLKLDAGLCYCLVHGFRYTVESGIRRKLRQHSCPVKNSSSASESSADENIELHVSTFKAAQGGMLAIEGAFDGENNGFINIARYVEHVKVERKLLTGDYYLKD